MTRYLIDFSYSGANFSGYQKQPGKRTVQDEIEKVLSSINNNSVKLTSSGRTDALVNAIHQKAHFDLDKEIGAYKLNGALNSYLPDDIYVNSVTKVDNLFHARYMVKSKAYEYLINTGDYNPLLRTHVYQYCKPLNIRKMKKAVKYFIGKHDFTTFVSAEDKKQDKVREIYDASVDEKEGIIKITFKGSGFLKYQVRNMVGTLIKIGEEKVLPDIILSLLEKKDRKCAFLCAPAQGLTLTDVKY
ncbi:tRNA pseudouridine synthase A [Clostridium sp. CAG:594]|nr:tRNA pseudouridine synthase A [Clostridium sp. CAG:594]